MESLLIWWNLTWEEGFPIYTTHFSRQQDCFQFISALSRELRDREMLGIYEKETQTCRLTIFPDKR